jgi:hypothetical protein
VDGSQRRCAGITKGGAACGFPPSPGRAWCLNHDPDRRDELAESRRRGGYNRKATARARKLLAAGTTSMHDVHQDLMLAFVRVREGEVELATAQAMAGLARALKDTAVSADYEQQIREIREELARIVAERADADHAQTA